MIFLGLPVSQPLCNASCWLHLVLCVVRRVGREGAAEGAQHLTRPPLTLAVPLREVEQGAADLEASRTHPVVPRVEGTADGSDATVGGVEADEEMPHSREEEGDDDAPAEVPVGAA